MRYTSGSLSTWTLSSWWVMSEIDIPSFFTALAEAGREYMTGPEIRREAAMIFLAAELRTVFLVSTS